MNGMKGYIEDYLVEVRDAVAAAYDMHKAGDTDGAYRAIYEYEGSLWTIMGVMEDENPGIEDRALNPNGASDLPPFMR